MASSRLDTAAYALLLVLAAIAVYSQVHTFDFVNFDDVYLIRDNPHINSGLSLEHMRSAFSLSRTTGLRDYFNPLTSISHMAVCQAFGLNPGMHHLLNLLLHIANALLLFTIFVRTTHSPGKSFLVAAMFALHPLNVESVAWIAERKNTLSTFFLLLGILAYVRYAEKPRVAAYLPIVVFFFSGLLSKPMVVTFPFVLLLLDYWPLRRFQDASPAHTGDALKGAWKNAFSLVLEKLPLFLMSIASVMVSFMSFHSVMRNVGSDVVVSVHRIPMSLRISNAIVTILHYPVKMVLPQNLAVFYPYPAQIPLWQVLCSLAIICTATAGVVWMRKRLPFLAVGWFWYLGTLVPILGIVQAGKWPAYADRWAYVPLIGLFIILAWGIPVAMERLKLSRAAKVAFLLVILLFWAGMAWIQTGYWKNSILLYSHAVDAVERNLLMIVNLGNAYAEKGMVDKAADCYAEAVRLRPDNHILQSRLGHLYGIQKRFGESMEHFSIALRLHPGDADTYLRLGYIYSSFGKVDEAARAFSCAARLDSKNAKTHLYLGKALEAQGRKDDAQREYSTAMKIDPNILDAGMGRGDLPGNTGEGERGAPR